MKRIDIRDLLNQSDEQLGEGETYAVERDGEVVGHFVPKKHRDPEADRAAVAAFQHRLADLRAKGWLDDEMLDSLNAASVAVDRD
ncbi:MAG: hypothetical protein U0893_17060 [Chloroflexota bacterium]